MDMERVQLGATSGTHASDWGRSTSTIKYSAAVPDDVLTIRTAIKEAEAAICLLEQELLLEFALEDEIAESEIADSEIADSDYSGEVRTRVGKATVKKEGKELGNWDKKDGSEATTPAVPSTNDEATDREDDLAARADYEEWAPPPRSVPICGDVRDVDFERLALAQQKARGSLFDVIMMDPPWQLASSNPTRGVAIGYSQLADWHIQNLPVRQLQQNGFIFMWVINAKYRFALQLLEEWGYRLVDEIVWVKQTVNRRLAKSHGFYLQHAKETCLVGFTGTSAPKLRANCGSDVLYSLRRGQSQKPEEIYELVEELFPGGSYLEIFGRRNNLRNEWTTVGNEL